MNKELVEIVARAICVNDGNNPDDFIDQDHEQLFWQLYIKQAKELIKDNGYVSIDWLIEKASVDALDPVIGRKPYDWLTNIKDELKEGE